MNKNFQGLACGNFGWFLQNTFLFFILTARVADDANEIDERKKIALNHVQMKFNIDIVISSINGL
jgi:hypothetical protein